MKDLIERLEKATENTRPLFEEAYLAAHGKPCWDDGERGDFFQRCLDIGAWESAALTLVPEGWTDIQLFVKENGSKARLKRPHPYALVAPMETNRDEDKLSSTPALALCIAALKAREDET